MQASAKSTVVSSWLRSSPEGKKQQVDSALEFALEAALAVRPTKPLLLVAEKLREWDAAVNGEWELRSAAETAFSRGDASGSGTLDPAALTAMRQSNAYSELVSRRSQ